MYDTQMVFFHSLWWAENTSFIQRDFRCIQNKYAILNMRREKHKIRFYFDVGTFWTELSVVSFAVQLWTFLTRYASKRGCISSFFLFFSFDRFYVLPISSNQTFEINYKIRIITCSTVLLSNRLKWIQTVKIFIAWKWFVRITAVTARMTFPPQIVLPLRKFS